MPDPPGHFRLDSRQDNTGTWRYRWDLTDPMSRIIASAEDFLDREAAERSIQWVKTNAHLCETIDPPDRGLIIG
jgi:uncharacterized protein YegP (UPF0339 family)